MASYIPSSETPKKRHQVQKREEELWHALSHGLPTSKLVKAAENLRSAYLALQKAKFHWLKEDQIQMIPKEKEDPAKRKRVNDLVKKTDKKIKDWSKKTVDEILAEYKTPRKIKLADQENTDD